MAGEPSLFDRIDDELYELWVDLEDLPGLLDEDPVAVELHPIVVEWGYTMAVVKYGLCQHYAAGEMTAIQRVVFRWLVHRLRESIPVMDRLDLERPNVRYADYERPTPEEERRARAYMEDYHRRRIEDSNRRAAEWEARRRERGDDSQKA